MNDGSSVKEFKESFQALLWRHTWNVLDIHEEKETEVEESQIESILESFLQQRKNFKSGLSSSRSANYKRSVDPNYSGPHIKLPITDVETVVEMMSFLGEGGRLPYKYVHSMVLEIIRILDPLPNITEIKIPVDGNITVCGDIHGQYMDLMTIFRINGLPSKTNVYIFNGDFVDRGSKGIEVLLVLYALKLWNPDCVHLNRGNHEQRHLNAKYGFEEEVRQKYDLELFDEIQASFRALPLVSVIDSKVLVLHGGLFSRDGVTLKEINLKKDRPNVKKSKTEMQVMEDILWSDPSNANGRFKNSRGAGVMFGPDVTLSFLKDNQLELVVRSHELQEEGFSLMHDNRLVTIFSASCYCGTNDNHGAFVIFQYGADIKNPRFEKYHADVETTTTHKTSFSAEEKCKEEALLKLREKIYKHRHLLLMSFTQVDVTKTGKINKSTCADVLRRVLIVDIPWAKLLPFLADIEGDDSILFTKFLERFKVKIASDFGARWMEAIIERICLKIYQSSGSLIEEFRKYDKDGNGSVEYNEFVEAMRKLELGLSNEQLYELMRAIDTDGSNSIDFEEFISIFQETWAKIKKEKDEEWIEKTIQEIDQLLTAKGLKKIESESKIEIVMSYKLVFGESANEISYQQFGEGLKKLGFSFSEGQIYMLASRIDAGKTKCIIEEDFEKVFKPPQAVPIEPVVIEEEKIEQIEIPKVSDITWQNVLIQKASAFFFENKVEVCRTFRLLDIDNSGKVDLQEFKEGITFLNKHLEGPLSELQIDELYHSLDKDGDGLINYEDFLESFSIVDVVGVHQLETPAELVPPLVLANEEPIVFEEPPIPILESSPKPPEPEIELPTQEVLTPESPKVENEDSLKTFQSPTPIQEEISQIIEETITSLPLNIEEKVEVSEMPLPILPPTKLVLQPLVLSPKAKPSTPILQPLSVSAPNTPKHDSKPKILPLEHIPDLANLERKLRKANSLSSVSGKGKQVKQSNSKKITSTTKSNNLGYKIRVPVEPDPKNRKQSEKTKIQLVENLKTKESLFLKKDFQTKPRILNIIPHDPEEIEVLETRTGWGERSHKTQKPQVKTKPKLKVSLPEVKQPTVKSPTSPKPQKPLKSIRTIEF